MRLAALASILTAGAMWLALGGHSAQSQPQAKPPMCQSCGKAADCPGCGAAKSCPHCQGHHGHRGHTWEYKCVHQSERATRKAAEAMTAQFNGLGEQGWRLSKADNGFWCFSRVRGAP